MTLREDADHIIREAINKVLPGEAVARALKGKTFDSGNLFVVAAGKAAWEMADAAAAVLRERITAGVVCTKYGHVRGEIPHIRCFEGGHPIPDENSFQGTQAAVDMVSGLRKEDTVLFLLSGGASALFEKPLIAKEGSALEVMERTAQRMRQAAIAMKTRRNCSKKKDSIFMRRSGRITPILH